MIARAPSCKASGSATAKFRGRATELVASVLARCRDVWRSINKLAAPEDGHKQIGITGVFGNPCCLLCFKIHNFAWRGTAMINFIDRVREKCAVRLAKSANLQGPRARSLRPFFGEFDAVLPFPTGTPHGAQFIDPAKGSIGLTSG